jgi:hypothetical protein
MEKNRAVERVEKRKYWEGQLNSWKASGLTQAAYCREKNLGVRRFLYWKKRIFPERPSATLVELPMRSVLADSPITVVVDGRCRIEIDKGFDPETLEKVLRVVCGR